MPLLTPALGAHLTDSEHGDAATLAWGEVYVERA
jgi:hypothetical protein